MFIYELYGTIFFNFLRFNEINTIKNKLNALKIQLIFMLALIQKQS